MISNIIIFVFQAILYIVFTLIKLILLPFDLIIETFIPSVSNALETIGDFLVICAQSLGWAISASGIPYSAISLVATYFIFKLTLPLQMWFLKLAFKWYRTIKP